MKLQQTSLNGLALAVSAFFVNWARYQAQYGHAPWKKGLFNLFTTWIIHYFALGLICGGVILVKHWTDGLFLPDKAEESHQTHDLIISVSQVMFVAALLFIVLSYMGPVGR